MKESGVNYMCAAHKDHSIPGPSVLPRGIVAPIPEISVDAPALLAGPWMDCGLMSLRSLDEHNTMEKLLVSDDIVMKIMKQKGGRVRVRMSWKMLLFGDQTWPH